MNKKLIKNNLIFKTGDKKKDTTYDFQKLKTIKFFRRKFYSGIYALNDTLAEKINLKDETDKFQTFMKPQSKSKNKTTDTLICRDTFKEIQKVLNYFKSRIFPIGKQGQEKRCPDMLALHPLDEAK